MISEYGKKTQRNLTVDCKTIEAEAFHHFKFCKHCIPGALDEDEEKRLCPEGYSYLMRMRKALDKKKADRLSSEFLEEVSNGQK